MGIQLPLTDLRLILRVLEGHPDSEEVRVTAANLRAHLEAHDAKKAAYEKHIAEQEAAKKRHFKHDARYDRIAEVSTLEQAARYEALVEEVVKGYASRRLPKPMKVTKELHSGPNVAYPADYDAEGGERGWSKGDPIVGATTLGSSALTARSTRPHQ